MYNILIVDDDEDIKESLKVLFKARGYNNCSFASNGLEAYDMCCANPPDLIVADVNMPYCNGYQFIKRLREDANYQFIPVIFLSEHTNIEDQEQGFESGCDYYFSKCNLVEQKAIFFLLIKSFLEKFRKQQEILNSIKSDHLTGLPLRDSLYKDLGKEKCESTILAVLDIDKFKNVNDTYGHSVGDKVIKEFSNICKSSLRSNDRIYRYGGEEFVIIFNTITIELAKIALERIKEKVKGHVFSEGFNVSFSAGLCELTSPTLIEECIEQADNALYKAKELGRDRVELAIGA